VVGGLAHRLAPQIVLYGATSTGRDLAPRVASLLRTGLTADCTDLRLGDHTVRGVRHERLLLQIRPAFGGNIIATIVSPEHRPQMASVREGVMRLLEPDANRRGEVVRVQVARGARHPEAGPARREAGAAHDDPSGPILLADDDLAVRLVRRVQEEKRVDLKGARIVVAGGAGVGSRDGWALVHELAETLGGVVGASRAAMDGGWVGPEHQVGQTGTTVRPKLYIAAGISGAIQHRAGMDQSARILAINTDPEAPIFTIAHYGIVGDLNDVIPRLLRAYKAKGDIGSEAGVGNGGAAGTGA
jgi:electron transfer flavoprotein alpha subunit